MRPLITGPGSSLEDVEGNSGSQERRFVLGSGLVDTYRGFSYKGMGDEAKERAESPLDGPCLPRQPPTGTRFNKRSAPHNRPEPCANR